MNDIVRPARLTDSQAMYAIKIAAHAGDLYLSLIPYAYLDKFLEHYTQSREREGRFYAKLEKMLNDKSTYVYIIERAGQVGGYMMARQNVSKTKWHLDSLFVDPVLQGGGLGSQLLGYFLAQIESPCELLVINSNKAAIRLYEKYGFKIVDHEAGFYYGAALAKMERLLT